MQKVILNKFNFEIEINANVEKVWDTALGEETYKVWAREFSPLQPSWYEGSFESGSSIKFLSRDTEGNLGGMISEIAESRKYEFLSIRHIGYMMGGVEDTTSEAVQSVMPGYENYTFEKIDDNKTKLKVYTELDPSYSDMMLPLWPRALAKLKEICE